MTTTELIARMRYTAEHGPLVAYEADMIADPALVSDALEELSAEVETLRKAARNIKPYLMWAISPESPGHHPTMPSAVHEFCAALEKLHD